MGGKTRREPDPEKLAAANHLALARVRRLIRALRVVTDYEEESILKQMPIDLDRPTRNPGLSPDPAPAPDGPDSDRTPPPD